jgi:transketolase
MRKQFVVTTEDLMEKDPRVVLLLGDIGVFGFRNAFKKFPDRTYNIGICEQAMTSLAAGLSSEGLIPFVHSIAPFVVERSYEQIKVDFCYQQLGANIVSVGASYDYAALGCTHHCPGDVAILRALPGMQIVVPGAQSELDTLLRAGYANTSPTYYRLSERSHSEKIPVQFGHANVLRKGTLGTVLTVGPMLAATLEATAGMDITLLYYSTIAPFDAATLRENCSSASLAVIEPFYEGTLSADILTALAGRSLRLLSLGVPRKFLTGYGDAADHDDACGLTAPKLRHRLEQFFHAAP